jgi:S-adenosylmethionine:tRNA ribosyltransferase-isomerase
MGYSIPFPGWEGWLKVRVAVARGVGREYLDVAGVLHDEMFPAASSVGQDLVTEIDGAREVSILDEARGCRVKFVMRVSDFHFELPEELIAQHPPAERGSSRMLVVDRATGKWTDEIFGSLPEILRPGDLLVLNDSRVLPTRLFAVRTGTRAQDKSQRPSGLVEVLLTEQVESEPGENLWRALVKPARKVSEGEVLRFFESGDGAAPVLTAEVVAVGEYGERTLRFAPVEDFYGTLGRIGHMPLPPYIRREQSLSPDAEEDRERYQTVYSQASGSAAAPTAGLHFTPDVLAALGARGVEVAYVTLHVGLGTFQPVRVERIEDIRLHAERYTLPAATAEALNRARGEGRRVIAVGTTTTRALEYIAAQAEGHVAAQTGSGMAGRGPTRFEAHSGSTAMFIAPGHRFRVVGGLLTNFHLPESTLLMLVSAFAGSSGGGDWGRETILAAYAHAIREGYRFYSYGDCMLLL